MRKEAWAAAATALLAGCFSLERETPPVRTYALSLERKAAEGGQGMLAVGRFEVSPRFAGREIVYRQTDVLYEADPYHAFLAEPAQLVREQVEAWLRDAGLFSHVGDPVRMPDADLRLEGVVEALYGDYRDRASPRARLELRVLARAADGRLALDRSYDADVPLRDLERATLVRGWEVGLRRILEALTADLRAAGRPPPPPAD